MGARRLRGGVVPDPRGHVLCLGARPRCEDAGVEDPASMVHGGRVGGTGGREARDRLRRRRAPIRL
eukprot:6448687-Alexandrium_andersonii.AAC.1